MQEKAITQILGKALDFVYSGENERPVRVINFRSRELGGLGLINPIIKSRAFMVKNMIKEAESKDIDIRDYREDRKV